MTDRTESMMGSKPEMPRVRGDGERASRGVNDVCKCRCACKLSLLVTGWVGVSIPGKETTLGR